MPKVPRECQETAWLLRPYLTAKPPDRRVASTPSGEAKPLPRRNVRLAYHLVVWASAGQESPEKRIGRCAMSTMTTEVARSPLPDGVEQYAGKWIALREGELVAAADSFD